MKNPINIAVVVAGIDEEDQNHTSGDTGLRR